MEWYKHNISEVPDIDVTSVKSELLKEMQMYSKYQEEHPIPEPPKGEYATEPFDDYKRMAKVGRKGK